MKPKAKIIIKRKFEVKIDKNYFRVVAKIQTIIGFEVKIRNTFATLFTCYNLFLLFY